MPEVFPSSPDARISALDDFFTEPVSPTTRCQGRLTMTRPIHGSSSGHGGIDHHRPKLGIAHGSARTSKQRKLARGSNPRHVEPVVSRGGRKPGTSRYYGVRFRPDLSKWVAEIRVAEWKSVDKKVWLGTFETEQAAARGVDLARKLLKCKKRHPPNLPCERLAGYSEEIPAHLNLQDLYDGNMFKQVVRFIKHACKEYAASFELQHQVDSYEILTDSASSEFSDMIMEMTGSVDVSYPPGSVSSSCCNYEVGMSTSPSPSPTGSCSSVVTLQEELQAPQTWESIRDGHGCQDPVYFSEVASPEYLPLGDEGLVSHPWAEFAYIWPELHDPSCFLPELPETFYGSPTWNSPAPLDIDDNNYHYYHYYQGDAPHSFQHDSY